MSQQENVVTTTVTVTQKSVLVPTSNPSVVSVASSSGQQTIDSTAAGATTLSSVKVDVRVRFLNGKVTRLDI